MLDGGGAIAKRGQDRDSDLWNLADSLRGRWLGDPLEFVSAAAERGLVRDWRDLSGLTRLQRTSTELVDPAIVPDLMVALTADRPAARVLDPWAGLGVTLQALDDAGRLTRGLGIEINRAVHDLAATISQSPHIDWQLGDASELLTKGVGEFDLIVGSPPIGLPPKTLHVARPTIDLRASGTYTMLVQAALALAPDGLMAIVLPDGFFLSSSQRIHEALAATSVYPSAVFALPARGFPTSIPMNVALFDRVDRQTLFVAEIDPTTELEAVVANYRARRDGALRQLGRMVPRATFTSWRTLVRDEDIQEAVRRAGLRPILIADLCTAIHRPSARGEPFTSFPNSVYLPKIGTSAAVTALDRLEIKPQNYVQLVISVEAADAEYVADFLNSSLGRKVRDELLTGATIPQISLASLGAGRMYLPPSIGQQRSALAAGRALRELRQSVGALERELWDRPLAARQVQSKLARLTEGDSFDRWMESLPFPLASILWRHRAADDPEKRCRYLINFFEATSVFLVDVHLSAFHSEPELIGPAARTDRSANVTYERGSIGVWTDLLARLAKRTRELLHADADLAVELYRVTDASRLAAIASRSVVEALMVDAANYRRKWVGHAAVASEREWTQRLAVADATLGRLRDALGEAFVDWGLVRAGGGRHRDGVVTTSIERLTGSRSLFKRDSAQLREWPQDGALYMLEAGQTLALKLQPLIRLRHSPESVEDACYFYDRIEKGGVRWISYHYEPQPEFVEPDEEAEALIRELELLG